MKTEKNVNMKICGLETFESTKNMILDVVGNINQLTSPTMKALILFKQQNVIIGEDGLYADIAFLDSVDGKKVLDIIDDALFNM